MDEKWSFVGKKQARCDPRDRGEALFGAGIRFEMAAEALEAGRAKEAAASLRKLVKENPRFIPAHVALGEALRAQGLAAEGVEAWFQGFETTGSPIFLTVLEDHFLSQEQPLAAIEALKRCVARARKVILMGRSSAETPVWEIMSAPVTTVTPADTINTCMMLMTDRKIRHLPVVDGTKVIGVLSIGDLVKQVIAEQEREIAQLQQYIAS